MAHIKQDQKVIKLADGIFGTTAAVYGAAYRNHTKKHFPIVIYAVQHLRKVLKTRGDEPIIFKPIRGSVDGLHFPIGNRIFVDPRGSTSNTVRIIAHELVHAEQHFLGKMQVGITGFRIWEGQEYRYPRSQNEYYTQPWELEAYARQNALADEAVSEAIKTMNNS